MTDGPDVLLARYFADCADERDMAALSAWICSSTDNARQFAVEAAVHSGIGEHIRTERQSINGSRRLSLRSLVLSSAAIIMLAVTLGLLFNAYRSPGVELAGEVNAVWQSHVSGLRGIQHLQQGIIRLKFQSGATAIVEAPAEFAVDVNRIDLHVGRVVVTCPTVQSRAVSVHAAGAVITDLGTQFGVRVDGGGAARLQVFQGAVELSQANSNIVYRAGQGTDFGTPSNAIIADTWLMPAQFDLASDASLGQSREAHWAKALAGLLKDQSLVFAARSLPKESQAADLVSAKPLQCPLPPVLEADRFGRVGAISVTDGRPAPSAELSRTFDAITLAAWVKLDESIARPDWHRSLLMTNGWDRPGQIHWQCKNDGVRISFFGRGDELDVRFSAKPQGLADGRWHFLSTTVQRLPHTRVTHSLDGATVFERSIDSSTPPLRLDSFLIGGWRDGQSADVQRPLYGAIDDVMVWSRALSPEEIKALYDSGRP